MRASVAGTVLIVIAVGLAACAADDVGDPSAPNASGVPGSRADSDGGGSSDGSGELPEVQPGQDAGGSSPPIPLGPPIKDLPAGKWSWVGFPEAKCRDGSSTGIGFNPSPNGSTKVMMFFQGGGACYSSATCKNNPSKFGEAEFAGVSGGGGGGLLNRSSDSNPVKDWNFVFVPYCTGDIHAGNNLAGTPPGVSQAQRFVGYVNVGHYLSRLVPTFPKATQVLVTGTSAGGFGALANYVQIARSFAGADVDVIDDSGPYMASPYLAPCLQERWKSLWKLGSTLLADCGPDCAGKSDVLTSYLIHVGKAHPMRQIGLVSASGDSTIRGFFGDGANDCTTRVPLTASTFEAGLADLRVQMAPYPNFGSFVFSGTEHTSLGSNQGLAGRTAAGVKLLDWVTAVVDEGKIKNVGP